MTENRIGIEEARATLGDLVDAARIAGITTTITRHSKPAARLIPVKVTYHLGDRDLDADRIRDLVQRELATVALVAKLPDRPGWEALVSAYAVAAERIFEIAPFRRLADEIGAGFDTDTEPMSDDDQAHVIQAAEGAIARACITLDAATWPTPSFDASTAARQLVEIAGLQRFILLMTGGQGA